MAKPSGRKVPTISEIRSWGATCSIEQYGAAMGVSRAHAYNTIKDGTAPVRTIPLGSRTRVVTSSLLALLEGADER